MTDQHSEEWKTAIHEAGHAVIGALAGLTVRECDVTNATTTFLNDDYPMGELIRLKNSNLALQFIDCEVSSGVRGFATWTNYVRAKLCSIVAGNLAENVLLQSGPCIVEERQSALQSSNLPYKKNECTPDGAWVNFFLTFVNSPDAEFEFIVKTTKEKVREHEKNIKGLAERMVREKTVRFYSNDPGFLPLKDEKFPGLLPTAPTLFG